MSVIMIGMASCGGNNHSTTFNKAKKVIDNTIADVNKAKTCDDVDAAVFSAVFGLIGIEGIDALSKEEQAEYDKISDDLSKAMEAKKAELDCKEESFFDSDDDDVPLDAPVEEEVE